MEEEETYRLLGIIDKCVAQLSEHFETVQIFTTKSPVDYKKDGLEPGDTPAFNRGTGNWFARYGQVDEWLICQKQAAKLSVKKANDD